MPTKCTFSDCNKRASYGHQKGILLRCKPHAEDGMTDVVNKKCEQEGCNVRPMYGYEKSKAIYCKKHADADMWNVKDRLCQEEGCKTRPNYGYEKGPATHCKEHAIPDMIDVKNRKCEECSKQATYGYARATHCVIHKVADMRDTRHPTCQSESCTKRPTFGYDERKGLYCSEHKEPDMKDVMNKKCEGCGLFVVGTKKFCQYCQPDPPAYRKTREFEVLDYLEQHVDHPFTHNKSSGFVCGNFRPDFLFDAGTHFVVVECDEKQHQCYDQSCEDARMLNICQALGLDTVFLRYNPDKFCISGQVKRIPKQKRLETLCKEIERQLANVPCKHVTVCRLYYDTDSEPVQFYTPTLNLD